MLLFATTLGFVATRCCSPRGTGEAVPSEEKSYVPYLEHQLDVLETLGAEMVKVPPDLAYAETKRGRLGCRVFQVPGLFRRVRMSYFEAGETQIFNALWYPTLDRDAPLLGIDLVASSKVNVTTIHFEEGVSVVSRDLKGVTRDLDDYIDLVRSAERKETGKHLSQQTAYDTSQATRPQNLMTAAFGKAFTDQYVHDFQYTLAPSLAPRRRPPLKKKQERRREPASLYHQIEWGKQMTRNSATPASILALFRRRGHAFSGRNLATAAHRLGKLGVGRAADPSSEKRLAAVCRRRIGELNAHELASTAWGFAKMGIDDSRLFDAIASEARDRVDDLNDQHISNLCWALATTGNIQTGFFFFDAVAKRASKIDFTSSSQALANTAWAFATVGVPAPDLFDKIASTAAQRLDEFTAQAIANTAWAFAKAGETPTVLFDAMAAEAVRRRCRDFNSQELANTVWAFATAGVAAPCLFETIADEAMRQIKLFNAQDMANTAWAFATVPSFSRRDRLFEALATEATRRIADFTPQNMANTAWALAKAGYTAPRLFSALGREAERRIDEFNALDLANTAWAFATAGITMPRLFDAIARSATLEDFDSQAIANIAWAFACTGWEDPEIFLRALRAVPGDPSLLPQPEKSQLYLVALYAGTTWPAIDLPLSAAQLASFRAAFTWRDPKPSQLQSDVSAMLEDMGWVHSFEHETDLGLSLDLAQPESRRAIEFDGPFHYLRDVANGDYVVNGPTRFKSRLLRALGWHLATVAFFEWDGLSESQRRRLLTEKLLRIGGNFHDVVRYNASSPLCATTIGVAR